MDAIKLLTSDHDTVRGLFDDFKKAKEADNTDRMREIQKKIFSEIDTHARIEEEIFYPAVRELGVDDLTEVVAEGIQEHHVVKVLMREIEQVSGDETFASKMAVLIENVEHHAEEEEKEMFPDLRKHMDDAQLDELGSKLEAAK